MHAVLERVVQQIAGEVSTLDPATTQIHPGGHDHEWTAQQIIEHLILGYRVTTRALEVRLNKGRLSRNQSRTWLQWWLQIMILSAGYLPHGAPALEETTPGPDDFAAMDGEELGRLLQQEMAALDRQLDRCKRKFGMERVATHPWLGPLRVDQWRRFHAVHGVHHLAQLQSVIARVVAAPAPHILMGRALAAKPRELHNARLVNEMQVPVEGPLA